MYEQIICMRLKVNVYLWWYQVCGSDKSYLLPMNPRNRNEMDSGGIEANYVYLFHIIISIIFILCFEFLFSWRKTGKLFYTFY